MTNETYGELTVVEMLWNYKNKHRTYCKCLGIDGKEYIVRQDALRSGITHSIKGANKAGRAKDITGQKFGMLTAICPSEKRAINGNIRWKCVCDCGNIIYPTVNNLERLHTTSCGCRKSSKWEIFIKEFLENNEIPFEYQKTFDNCKNTKNNRCLIFDFYIETLKVAIEYDGEQHYHSVDYFGGEERFKIQQKYDDIKNKYCRDNNIKLIRIPYNKNKNDIIQILNNILHPATTTV